MSLFAIADLHLSFGVDKPMDVFSGWSDYVERIERNWKAKVKPSDTVVVAGDISWAMTLDEAVADFSFVNSLPGRKILLRGNHDYYFSTRNKMEKFFESNGFNSLNFLFNNSFECDNVSVCGTRGWVNMTEKTEFDKKILKREAGRLRFSLQSAVFEPIVFLHYPPVFRGNRSDQILRVLKEFKIKSVYYGHLHGPGCRFALNGNFEGITYRLISSDYLKFDLIKIF